VTFFLAFYLAFTLNFYVAYLASNLDILTFSLAKLRGGTVEPAGTGQCGLGSVALREGGPVLGH
jgi:hypothetical protein